LAADEAKQSRALGAERHPDADFISAAGHRVRDSTVNAKAEILLWKESDSSARASNHRD